MIINGVNLDNHNELLEIEKQIGFFYDSND